MPTPSLAKTPIGALRVEHQCDSSRTRRRSPWITSLGGCVTAALASQLNAGVLGTLLVADDPGQLRAVGGSRVVAHRSDQSWPRRSTYLRWTPLGRVALAAPQWRDVDHPIAPFSGVARHANL